MEDYAFYESILKCLQEQIARKPDTMTKRKLQRKVSNYWEMLRDNKFTSRRDFYQLGEHLKALASDNGMTLEYMETASNSSFFSMLFGKNKSIDESDNEKDLKISDLIDKHEQKYKDNKVVLPKDHNLRKMRRSVLTLTERKKLENPNEVRSYSGARHHFFGYVRFFNKLFGNRSMIFQSKAATDMELVCVYSWENQQRVNTNTSVEYSHELKNYLRHIHKKEHAHFVFIPVNLVSIDRFIGDEVFVNSHGVLCILNCNLKVAHIWDPHGAVGESRIEDITIKKELVINDVLFSSLKGVLQSKLGREWSVKVPSEYQSPLGVQTFTEFGGRKQIEALGLLMGHEISDNLNDRTSEVDSANDSINSEGYCLAWNYLLPLVSVLINSEDPADWERVMKAGNKIELTSDILKFVDWCYSLYKNEFVSLDMQEMIESGDRHFTSEMNNFPNSEEYEYDLKMN